MSSPFRDPRILDGEKSIYSVRVGRNPSTSQLTSVIEHDNGAYVAYLESGSKDSFGIKVEQRFLRENGHIMIDSYRAESRFKDRVVSREEGFFTGTEHIPFGGELAPYPRGVMPLLGGLTLLRGMDFTRGAKLKLDFWMMFSITWPIEARVEKRTTLNVEAGQFDTWQVNIRPSFSHISGLLDKVVAGFLPPFTAHFDTADTHRMIRFSFPSGPLPSHPKCVLELTA